MNLKALIMNKQIMLAVGIIMFVGAMMVYGTGAFFSDTAQATGNVFTAGTLDLKVAMNSGSNSPTGGWLDTQTAPWNFAAMAPGGTPDESSVWLKNTGTVDGMKLGIAAANTETVGGYEKQVRITKLTFDGSNLLEGGAGATIPDYEAPTNCTVTVSGSRITDAIFNASNGDVICVSDGNYSSTWEAGATNPSGGNLIVVNKEVTIASVNGPANTSSTGFKVTANNVTVKGFEITAPNEISGVQATDVSGLTVTHNNIHDVATTNSSGSAQGIYLHGNTANISNIEFSYNRINNIGNNSVVRSAKGIYIGDTAGTGVINGVNITNNIVTNVIGNTNSSYATGGRGGYGITTNHGGNVQNLVIANNTVSNLSGLWTTAIGLEGRTQGANVSLNDIGVSGSVGGADIGVNFEANISAAGVTVKKNNFDSSIAGVVINHNFPSFTGTIDATDNWWGDFDPLDQISENNGHIDTSNFAGGPFAGFIGGTDQNGNGYADMQDLRLTPIVGATPGLNAGEEKRLIMAVQLDGPTTGNNFQGAGLTTKLTFTLNQI